MTSWRTVNKGVIDSSDDATELQIEQLLLKYKQALQIHLKGDREQAKQHYESLLANKLIEPKQKETVDDKDTWHEDEGPTLTTLRYLVLKNYASLLQDEFKDDRTNGALAESAIQRYLQALKVDASDQAVWYAAGYLCQQTKKWRLARLAYEHGICPAFVESIAKNNSSKQPVSMTEKVNQVIKKGELSPMQWKCLQGLCEVLYELGDDTLSAFYTDIVTEAYPGWQKGDRKEKEEMTTEVDDSGGEPIVIELKEATWNALLTGLLEEACKNKDGRPIDTEESNHRRRPTDHLLNTTFYSRPVFISLDETKAGKAEESGEGLSEKKKSSHSAQDNGRPSLEEETTVSDRVMAEAGHSVAGQEDEETAGKKRKRSKEEEEEKKETGDDNGEEEEAEEKRTSLRTFKRKKEKIANEETSRKKMMEEEKEFLNKVQAYYDKMKDMGLLLPVEASFIDAGESFPAFWHWFDHKVSELDSGYCWDIQSQSNLVLTEGSRKPLLLTPSTTWDNEGSHSDRHAIPLPVQQLNENNSGITDALCQCILSFVKQDKEIESRQPLSDTLLGLLTDTITLLEVNLIQKLSSWSPKEKLKMAVRMAEYMVDRLIRNTMQLEEEKRLRSSTTTVHGGSSSSSSQRKKTSWAARRKRQEELTEQTDVWSSVVDQYLCSERLSAMNGDHDNEGVCRQMYLRYCIVKAKRAECHYAIEDAYHWYVQAMSWMDKWTTLARGEIHGQSMYDAKMCQEGLEKKLALLQVVRLYREAEKKMKEGDEKGAIEVLEEVVVPLLEEKELGATDETLQMVSMLSEAYKKTGRVKEAWRCSTFVFCHLMQQLLLYGNQPLSIEQRFNKERNKAFFQYVSKINDSLDTFLLIQQQTKEAQDYLDGTHPTLFAQLACLLRMTVYYLFRHPDFIPLVNNFTEPDVPQHRPSKTSKGNVFNQVIVKAWVCQSSLVQTKVRQQMQQQQQQQDVGMHAILSLGAEVMQELHDELGEREICDASNGIYLQHLLETLVKVDDKRFRRDIYQCYHCLYGVHLAAETDAIEEHHCSHLKMDQKAAAPLFGLIVEAAVQKLKSGQLLKADLKDVVDTVSEHFEELSPKGHPWIKQNADRIEAYLKRGIRFHSSFDQVKRTAILPTVEICPEKTHTSPVFFRICWIRGKTLRIQITNRLKGSATDKNMNDLEMAVQQFKYHLMLNPNDADGWHELAACYQLLAEEELNWSASNIAIRKNYISEIQRMSFHAYIRGFYLDALPSQDAVKYGLYLQFGHLLYSMASPPMQMAAFEHQDTITVMDATGAVSASPHTPPKPKSIYKLAFLMYSHALKYPALDEWRSSYMAGKCLVKLERPPQEALVYYLQAIKKAKPKKKEKREPIVEPVYLFYSTLLKQLFKQQMSPECVREWIAQEKKVSFCTPKPVESAAAAAAAATTTEVEKESERAVYDMILQRLNDIRAFDTKGWHHRPLYRIAWMYDQVYHDSEKAKTELMKLFIFKEKVRNYISIWKTSFELPGKHYVYNTKYTLFLIRVCKEARDIQTLKQLYRKVRRAQSILINEVHVFYKACIAYLDVLDQHLSETYDAPQILQRMQASTLSKEEFEKRLRTEKEKWKEEQSSSSIQGLKKDLQDLADLQRQMQGYLTGQEGTFAHERWQTTIQWVYGAMVKEGSPSLLQPLSSSDPSLETVVTDLSDVLFQEAKTFMQELPLT